MVLLSDNRAIMDISLVQVGLAIVSTFFLLGGYVLVYDNPLQSSQEIQSVANQIKSMIFNVDQYWFEQHVSCSFPHTTLPLIAEFSQDYLLIRSPDTNQQEIKALPQTLWICDDNNTLNSAFSFHQSIQNLTGNKGTRSDPCSNDSIVLNWLDSLWNQSQSRFHHHPFIWYKADTLYLEKCIIYKRIYDEEKNKSIPLFECIILKTG